MFQQNATNQPIMGTSTKKLALHETLNELHTYHATRVEEIIHLRCYSGLQHLQWDFCFNFEFNNYNLYGVWVYGCMGVWVYGCMGVWVYGCMGVWVYGCMGVWVYGCMGVWVGLRVYGWMSQNPREAI